LHTQLSRASSSVPANVPIHQHPSFIALVTLLPIPMLICASLHRLMTKLRDRVCRAYHQPTISLTEIRYEHRVVLELVQTYLHVALEVCIDDATYTLGIGVVRGASVSRHCECPHAPFWVGLTASTVKLPFISMIYKFLNPFDVNCLNYTIYCVYLDTCL
jgi:hypothetical protein